MRSASSFAAMCVFVTSLVVPIAAIAQPEPAAPPPAATPPITAGTQPQPDAEPAAPAVPAGTPGNVVFNGEHVSLRTADGLFQLSPIGYLNTNYTVYDGNGTPPDGFALKRARFGFQGGLGKEIEYTLVSDVVANGISVRDAYVQFKPFRALQLRIGQFKEPFSQEVATVDTNVEFFDRSLVSVLYPSATGSFRSPGAMILGRAGDGLLDYWVGAFNGRGILAPASSNWPEIVGRLRVSPLRWTGVPAIKHFSIGGSFSLSRSAAIAKDQSFSGLINDGAYTFFPTFPINGPVQRFGAELLWLAGPFGLRGEYVQLHQAREDVGSGSVGGAGFETFPTIAAQGAYGQLSCFLTGESEDEYAPPKVRHPVLGPDTPGYGASRGVGAIQLAARVSWLYAKAPGQTYATFTPTSVPEYKNYTDQLTVGVNWYLNYWTLYKLDLDIDQLRQPSVEGFLPQNYYVVIQQIQFRF
jgi:phosphate-selective porin OprO/OprP